MPCGCSEVTIANASQYRDCVIKTTDVAHLDVSNMAVWKGKKDTCNADNSTFIWHTCIVNETHAAEIEKYFGKVNVCVQKTSPSPLTTMRKRPKNTSLPWTSSCSIQTTLV